MLFERLITCTGSYGCKESPLCGETNPTFSIWCRTYGVAKFFFWKNYFISFHINVRVICNFGETIHMLPEYILLIWTGFWYTLTIVACFTTNICMCSYINYISSICANKTWSYIIWRRKYEYITILPRVGTRLRGIVHLPTLSGRKSDH